MNLESIKKTTKSIEKLYSILCELDMNGKKNTKEYNEYLDYLQIALEVENSKYAELSNQQLKKIMDEKDIDERIKQKADMFYKLELDNEEINALLAADNKKLKDKYIFYAMLEEEISKNKTLTVLKYVLLYADTKIEEYAIQNKFDMSKNNKIIIEQELLDIPIDEIEKYTSRMKIQQIINKLLKKDFNRTDEESLIDILKLRTALTYLDDEEILSTRQTLNSLDSLDVNKYFLTIIKNSFDNSHNDKNKYKVNKLKI